VKAEERIASPLLGFLFARNPICLVISPESTENTKGAEAEEVRSQDPNPALSGLCGLCALCGGKALYRTKPAFNASSRNICTVSSEYWSRSLPTKGSFLRMSAVTVMMEQPMASAWKMLSNSRGLAHSNST